jgi:hypothetical protein
MTDLRRLIAWLLLALVGVVGLGGAVLGVSLSPDNATLSQAVANTKAASSYTQVVTEKTTSGDQDDTLVWQAPNRLGGYIESGSKRTYVYVLPSTTGSSFEYQSLTVTPATPTRRLVFYRQASESATLLNPAYRYLSYASEGKHIVHSGNTYSFTLSQTSSQGKETGTFVYTVSGQYISQFDLTVQGASVHLVLSDIGSSPPVNLPKGAKVVAAPTTGTPGASGGSGTSGG